MQARPREHLHKINRALMGRCVRPATLIPSVRGAYELPARSDTSFSAHSGCTLQPSRLAPAHALLPRASVPTGPPEQALHAPHALPPAYPSGRWRFGSACMSRVASNCMRARALMARLL